MISWPLSSIVNLTDADIEFLRSEPKRRSSSTRAKVKAEHQEQQYELVSAMEDTRHFTIFTRQSSSHPGVFSVGLTLILPEKNLVLCRYNSGHHTHRNRIERNKVPATPHRHLATERYIQQNLDPDGYAEPCEGYQTTQEALAKLVQDCHVQGILTSGPQQSPLALT